MFQKKSGVLALGLLMQMIFISLSSAVAADSCPKLDEEKISKLES
jgi:hypothetical protein